MCVVDLAVTYSKACVTHYDSGICCSQAVFLYEVHVVVSAVVVVMDK